jgi:hypothetical protein
MPYYKKNIHSILGHVVSYAQNLIAGAFTGLVERKYMVPQMISKDSGPHLAQANKEIDPNVGH